MVQGLSCRLHAAGGGERVAELLVSLVTFTDGQHRRRSDLEGKG